MTPLVRWANRLDARSSLKFHTISDRASSCITSSPTSELLTVLVTNK